jgi:hypothetical protein
MDGPRLAVTAAMPAAEGSAAALKPAAVEASAAETLKTPAAEAVGSWSAAALKTPAAEAVGNWSAAALEAGRRRSAAKAAKAAPTLSAMERRAASVQTGVGRNAAVHAGA